MFLLSLPLFAAACPAPALDDVDEDTGLGRFAIAFAVHDGDRVLRCGDSAYTLVDDAAAGLDNFVTRLHITAGTAGPDCTYSLAGGAVAYIAGDVRVGVRPDQSAPLALLAVRMHVDAWDALGLPLADDMIDGDAFVVPWIDEETPDPGPDYVTRIYTSAAGGAR